MDEGAKEFSQLVDRILRRFFAQNGCIPPAHGECLALGARLWAQVAERGLPAPLGPGEAGVPGGMTESECAPLVARLLDRSTNELLASAAKQLVKACFYPEFSVCRDSFREVATDGGCRRQELKRVRGRISGAHCVDCPHWVARSPADHEAFLAGEWHEGAAEFRGAREVFLPEDFRALRRWLHTRARDDGFRRGPPHC